MKAFVKEDLWDQFKGISNKYGFYLEYKPNRYFTKRIDDDILLIINKKTREMQLITPAGGSPFMEVHTQFYQDLFDDGYIEFVEGRFD